MTSVTGHMMELEFDENCRKWHSVAPVELFDRPVQKYVKEESKDLKRTLVDEAKKAGILLLWLDCDLEGENIAYEVINICKEANNRLDIYRARFSALIPRDIFRTLNHPDRPNPHLNDAVDARQEIDLRLGAAFTRFQTLRLQKKYENLDSMISYGPCQFPTLGFVVERYHKIEAFVSEKFWFIECSYEYEDPDSLNGNKLTCSFNWDRNRVYDRMTVLILYEMCLENGGKAVVTKCDERPTSKRRPIPLNTVELQKRASRKFHMSSETTMQVAESLYQRGILSYPRTETEAFKEGTDLVGILSEHREHSQWGQYVQGLLDNNKFSWPIPGKGDDQAHPPIHPTKCVEPNELTTDQEKNIYDLVTRHFLACCSKDAKGNQTNIQIKIPDGNIDGETFSGTGLMITERNFLDIYSKYDSWSANKVPVLRRGDTFTPSILVMTEGKTSPPQPLSESDLITEMDRHNIGTDATIAAHISTIQQREYVEKDGQNRFIPTKLGIALIEAYNEMGYQLNKPYLRASMEADCQKIAKGEISKGEVVKACLNGMKKCFIDCNKDVAKLDAAIAKYFTPLGGGHAIEEYNTLKRNFSECGDCHRLMDLKQDEVSKNRVLHCVSCRKTHQLPNNGTLTANEHKCMIKKVDMMRSCGFQVVNVKNEETQKTHQVCPKCFKDPPGPPFSAENSSDFRCFACCESSCPLSGNLGSPSIAPCPDPNCNGSLKLQKNNNKWNLYCDAHKNKDSKFYNLSYTLSASANETIICESCSRKINSRVLKLQVEMNMNDLYHLTTSKQSFCVFCEWQKVYDDKAEGRLSLQRLIAARNNNNNNQHQQQHQQQQHQQHQQQHHHQQQKAFPQFQQNNMRANQQQQQQQQQQRQQTTNENVRNPSNFFNPISIAVPMDYTAASTGANYNKGQKKSVSKNNVNESKNSIPNCSCGISAKQLKSTKENSNKGREFFTCGNNKACTFFLWAHEYNNSELETNNASQATCSHCKRVGHFARSCPNKRK